MKMAKINLKPGQCPGTEQCIFVIAGAQEAFPFDRFPVKV
jgi:hypothetical protein